MKIDQTPIAIALRKQTSDAFARRIEKLKTEANSVPAESERNAILVSLKNFAPLLRNLEENVVADQDEANASFVHSQLLFLARRIAVALHSAKSKEAKRADRAIERALEDEQDHDHLKMLQQTH